MLTLRAVLFYLGYGSVTIVWGGLCALFGWLIPFPARFHVIIGCWTRFCLWWLRVTCGIRHRVIGAERIPHTPCIVLCRHESTWETLFLQRLFAPQATLIKRELLHIPFFGWAFRTLRPIAIDRREPRKALRELIRTGTERLRAGIWVVLFPEGTRMPVGTPGRFQPGGAALAAASGYPLLVVVHDAGAYWPAHAVLKRPGTVRVLVGEPVPTEGRSSKDIQRDATRVFESLMSELHEPEAARAPAAGEPA